MFHCMSFLFFSSLILQQEHVQSAAGESSEPVKPSASASSSSLNAGFTLVRPQAPGIGRAPEENGPQSLGWHNCTDP